MSLKNSLGHDCIWKCLENCWSRPCLFALEMLNDEQRSVYTHLGICVPVPWGSGFLFNIRACNMQESNFLKAAEAHSYLQWVAGDVSRALMLFLMCTHLQLNLLEQGEEERRKRRKSTQNMLCIAERNLEAHLPSIKWAFSCLLVAEPLLSPKPAVPIRFLKPRSQSQELSKSPRRVPQSGYQMVSPKSFEELSHILG